MGSLTVDPRARLGLLACAGVLAVTLERAESLGLLAAITALPVLLARPSWAALRGGALAVALVVWGTALSQGLFYREEPRVALLAWGPLTLWREGVTWGLVQSLRLIAVTLAGLGVALTTPPDRLFAALIALRVPFGLAFMAVTALRFVPEVAREWFIVRDARARRSGRPAWRRTPWSWVALEVDLLRPVIARALRRARLLAESLDTRGFDPVAPRSLRRPLVWGSLDVGLLAVAGAVTVGLVGARVLWRLYTLEVLYVPALRPLYGWVRAWL